ncbi:MAG TPA: hypothetical protein VHM19_12440 [Polyangiales bacterium]|nr:hypothetical protein [Polyangiales bacterium]
MQRLHVFRASSSLCFLLAFWAALSCACSGSSPRDKRGGVSGTTAAGSGGHASLDAAFGNSDASPATLDAGPRPVLRDGEACAWAHAKPVRVVPSVWLTLEYSGATGSLDGFVAHWTKLRDALLAPGAVVDQSQAAVDFGLIVHEGDQEDQPACPKLTSVDPATNNYAAINGATPVTPPPLDGSERDGHPVYALQLARTRFAAARAAAPGVPVVQVVVLANGATNVENICSKDLAAWKQSGEATVEDVGPRVTREAVKALAADGAKVFVISVLDGAGTPDAQSVALAQLGNTGHGVFATTSPAEITAALTTILHDVVSCEFPLNGEVTLGHECEGKVTLEGAPLACNDPNGWRLKDKKTVELVGSACAGLRDHPTNVIEAQFPCAIWKGPD